MIVDKTHLSCLRERLAVSLAIESKDPSPLLAWLDSHISYTPFKSQLAVRADSRSRQEHGSRDTSESEPSIATHLGGGLFGMLARETPDHRVQFLLQAIEMGGNTGLLQFGPTVQSTWSDVRRAELLGRPPMLEVFTANSGVRIVYQYHEDGPAFRTQNILAILDDEGIIETKLDKFCWASLSQIKELALMADVINPFVKKILLPL